ELKVLLVSDVLIRFCEHVQHAFVVVWCMKVIERPVTAIEFGVLSGVEVAAAVLIYLPAAHLADRFHKRPFVLATFVMFTLFPLTLLLCRSFWPLVGAFALRGLKEFGEPTRKALIVDLCPVERRATMFGFYYLVRDSIVSVAAAGGALLWQVSPSVNLIAAASFGAAGTVLFALRGGRRRSADQAS
ncbi:MAG: MFS transporter, partial [Phycisphaerales bacterium]